jgi:hypothetical protein
VARLGRPRSAIGRLRLAFVRQGVVVVRGQELRARVAHERDEDERCGQRRKQARGRRALGDDLGAKIGDGLLMVIDSMLNRSCS